MHVPTPITAEQLCSAAFATNDHPLAFSPEALHLPLWTSVGYPPACGRAVELSATPGLLLDDSAADTGCGHVFTFIIS